MSITTETEITGVKEARRAEMAKFRAYRPPLLLPLPVFFFCESLPGVVLAD
jgi:hypothetical protein